ncbi:MAG: hypothetical protein JNK15_09370 [Planctomycetes bacterium]|nr:hypothetical protein [Planctomycetota bacterium]
MGPTRLIATGASNLARLTLAVLDAERARVAGPVEMHAAAGFGRSYCVASRFLVRGLGPIDTSPMWAHLAATDAADRARTTALLMDVGNDLLYGLRVDRILAAVEGTLVRLCTVAERVVVVGLPIATVRTVTKAQFLLVRTVLVPGSPLTFADAREGAERLHDGLRTLAERHGAAFREHRPEWYGFDPMHVRRRNAAAATRDWLAAPASASMRPFDTWTGRWRLRLAGPAERTWCGVRCRHVQPALLFRDGSSLSLW